MGKAISHDGVDLPGPIINQKKREKGIYHTQQYHNQYGNKKGWAVFIYPYQPLSVNFTPDNLPFPEEHHLT
jgi:hypothetical protein